MTAILTVVLACTISTVSAQGSPTARRVVVDLLNGRRVSGTFESLTADGLMIRTTSIDKIPRDRIFRIDFPQQKTTSGSPQSFVFLSNGDRIAVNVSKSDGEDLHGVWSKLPGKPAVKVPLLFVRGFTTDAKGASNLFERHRKLDLVILNNGDRISGRLKSLDEKSAVMMNAAGPIERKAIRAVIFDPRFLDKPKISADYILVGLRDGTKLTASEIASSDDKRFAIKTVWGASITIPAETVLSLQFLSKRVESLSARTATRTAHTPWISGKRPVRINRNLLGKPLRLRGKEYQLGLGCSTRTRIDYDLKGDEKFFRATLGIDDAAGGKGSVVFRVELDGKSIFTSQQLTGKSPPLVMKPLAIRGGKRLTLIADYATRGDLLDYANWCDAILIK